MEETKQKVVNLASKPTQQMLGTVLGQGARGPPATPTAPSPDPAAQLLWPTPSAPAPMQPWSLPPAVQ